MVLLLIDRIYGAPPYNPPYGAPPSFPPSFDAPPSYGVCPPFRPPICTIVHPNNHNNTVSN